MNLVLIRQPLDPLLGWYYSDLLALVDSYIDWQKRNQKPDAPPPSQRVRGARKK